MVNLGVPNYKGLTTFITASPGVPSGLILGGKGRQSEDVWVSMPPHLPVHPLNPRLFSPAHNKCQRNTYLLEDAGNQDIQFCSEAKSSRQRCWYGGTYTPHHGHWPSLPPSQGRGTALGSREAGE